MTWGTWRERIEDIRMILAYCVRKNKLKWAQSSLNTKAWYIFCLPVLVRVCIAVVRHHDQNEPWKERVCSSFQCSGYTLSLSEARAGSQRRRQGAEAGAEATEACCWLACSACSLGESSLPWAGIVHNELAPPTSITNQENGPQVCPQANLTRKFPKLRFLLLKWL